MIAKKKATSHKLTVEEEAILNAEPAKVEKELPKITWPKIPYVEKREEPFNPNLWEPKRFETKRRLEPSP